MLKRKRTNDHMPKLFIQIYVTNSCPCNSHSQVHISSKILPLACWTLHMMNTPVGFHAQKNAEQSILNTPAILQRVQKYNSHTIPITQFTQKKNRPICAKDKHSSRCIAKTPPGQSILSDWIQLNATELSSRRIALWNVRSCRAETNPTSIFIFKNGPS